MFGSYGAAFLGLAIAGAILGWGAIAPAGTDTYTYGDENASLY